MNTPRTIKKKYSMAQERKYKEEGGINNLSTVQSIMSKISNNLILGYGVGHPNNTILLY